MEGGLMISKILASKDGSKTAQKAARYAVALAKQLNHSVIIMSVICYYSKPNPEKGGTKNE
jgi:nucleotide-binding universal stress UspA family protein